MTKQKEAKEILAKNGIDLNEQLEKCKKCPCMKDGKRQACIMCEHHEKECADSDCSTAHINRSDNLALCSADDCVITRIAANKSY